MWETDQMWETSPIPTVLSQDPYIKRLQYTLNHTLDHTHFDFKDKSRKQKKNITCLLKYNSQWVRRGYDRRSVAGSNFTTAFPESTENGHFFLLVDCSLRRVELFAFHARVAALDGGLLLLCHCQFNLRLLKRAKSAHSAS